MGDGEQHPEGGGEGLDDSVESEEADTNEGILEMEVVEGYSTS